MRDETTTDYTSTPRTKLQAKLRELFQFESADLDFGIYRILNHKRDDIERFIEQDLLDAVGEALRGMTGERRAEIEALLAVQKDKIKANLGRDAIDAHGELAKAFRALPIVEDYLDLQARLARIKVAEVTEAHIYSDLLKFFSRYYDKGDFCTLRRYSSRNHKYMVPYDGEEVMLHWANKDQYYIKSGERFTDYRFEAGEQKVWFKLAAADTPDDNNKSTGRYFIVPSDDCIDYNADQKLLTVRFAYRPLSEAEQEKYLAAYQAISGDKRKTVDRSVLNEVTEKQILDAAALSKKGSANIKGRILAAHPTSKAGRSVLGHHLNRYTAANTHDYFVHKDLGGFLRRELDFFLKNEVLQVDNYLLGDGGEKAYERELLRARAVRHIAERIIQFLAQIEDFQKRLFEKKKFVTQTDWCVTLDHVPEELYPAILENTAQLEKWFELYAINKWDDGPKSVEEIDDAFLCRYSAMMVDTGLFGREFKDQFLASVNDLEKIEDGLLLHGNNLHALDLLETSLNKAVTCTYIDPPYNTGNDGFVYRDYYQHSCWLSMMWDRLSKLNPLLSKDAIFYCSIDDHEVKRLRFITDSIFDESNLIAELIWKARQFIDSRANTRISNDHEYVLCYRTSKSGSLRGAEKDLSKYQNPDNDPNGVWMSRSMLGLANAEQRPNLHYDLINPETGNRYPCPAHTGWRYSRSTMKEKIQTGRILWPASLDGRPREKVFLNELNDQYTGFSTFLEDVYTAHGSGEIRDFFGELVIQFPKPSKLVRQLVAQGDMNGIHSLVLDYFAGSGTTAHAVIDLNREDGGDRKYILVEMGEYFDTVLMPRIQKVVFAEKWKDGVPQFDGNGESSGVSHIFKYQRLESYEDALNNIELTKPDLEQHEFPSDYMLGYMLDVESRGSKSLLDIEAFDKPFDYKLNIQRGDVTPRPQVVDLQETFHYLIGMRVEKMEVREHQGREYRISRGQVPGAGGLETAVVVWRDLAPELDWEEEKRWAREELLTEPVDRVYANGPSGITGYLPIEYVFKEKMDPVFGGES